MTAHFTVHVRSDHDAVRLSLVGELDLGAVADLDAAYRQARATRRSGVEIDVSALEFCDLVGQRALLRCQSDGAVLIGAPPVLQHLFALTAQSQLLPREPDGRWPASYPDTSPRAEPDAVVHAALVPACS